MKFGSLMIVCVLVLGSLSKASKNRKDRSLSDFDNQGNNANAFKNLQMGQMFGTPNETGGMTGNFPGYMGVPGGMLAMPSLTPPPPPGFSVGRMPVYGPRTEYNQEEQASEQQEPERKVKKRARNLFLPFMGMYNPMMMMGMYNPMMMGMYNPYMWGMNHMAGAAHHVAGAHHHIMGSHHNMMGMMHHGMGMMHGGMGRGLGMGMGMGMMNPYMMFNPMMSMMMMNPYMMNPMMGMYGMNGMNGFGKLIRSKPTKSTSILSRR